MRIIHLGFQLHLSYDLQQFKAGQSYFSVKEKFQLANEQIYQPFFALLERNTQKYKSFRCSLMVSGLWLEIAERYDAELVQRLKKLVRMGRVELIAEPYYHSMAFFYDQDEFAEQMKLQQEELKSVFGVEPKLCAFPEMTYNDNIGRAAEGLGYVGMLVGGSERVLGWHSPNHVYEAAGCQYLRLLFRNSHLMQKILTKDSSLMVEKKITNDSDEKRPMLSGVNFQKLLELDCLRGGLVNLYFDVEVFRKLREDGIVGFFDELIRVWLENHCQFVKASEACVVEAPTAEISVKETVSWRFVDVEDKYDAYETQLDTTTFLPVMLSQVECRPPRWLEHEAQMKELYQIRRGILASEDESLISDFRKLTTVDYQLPGWNFDDENWQLVLADLKTRADEIKKSQAVEISRAYTKRRDRGDIDSVPVRLKNSKPVVENGGVVKVSIGGKVGNRHGRDANVEKSIQRVSRSVAKPNTIEVVREPKSSNDNLAAQRPLPPVAKVRSQEVVLPETKAPTKPQKPKTHAIRRVIKRLVIE